MFKYRGQTVDSYEKLLVAVGDLKEQEHADRLYDCAVAEFGESHARLTFGFMLAYFKTPARRAEISRLLKGVVHPVMPTITERDANVEEAITVGLDMAIAYNNGLRGGVLKFIKDDKTPSEKSVFEQRADIAEWNI